MVLRHAPTDVDRGFSIRDKIQVLDIVSGCITIIKSSQHLTLNH